MRRVFLVCLALCLAAVSVTSAAAQEAVLPSSEAPSGTSSPLLEPSFPFLDDASISGSLYYFQRIRNRYNPAEDKYDTNLHHATGQLSMEFNSGWLGNFFGLDVGAFAALDFQNSGSPAHEMNFFPWRDPWNADWSAEDADDGASVYKAQARIQAGPVWAKGGWFQPSGPGVLGVNWSFLPGTYLGAEAGFNVPHLSFAAAFATEYKAPWFKDTYKFRRNDGTTPVDYIWSMGAALTLLEERFRLELAYGESEGYLQNGHLKARYSLPFENSALTLSYHLYLMGDSDDSGGVNDNFDGLAQHHFLAARYETAPWTFQLEALHTRAPENSPESRGYFAYRLISAYGGANGAYEPWWDLRSDWDHDNETAIFAKISRTGEDFGLPGLSAGISFAYGFDGQARGHSTHLAEYAFGFDIAYTVQEGCLEGSMVKLHYTDYRNRTNQPDWSPFKNAFQDERDIKLTVIIPF